MNPRIHVPEMMLDQCGKQGERSYSGSQDGQPLIYSARLPRIRTYEKMSSIKIFDVEIVRVHM